MHLSFFPRYWWIIASFAPCAIVALWGIVLSYRHRRSQPHGAKWFIAAIMLFIGGYFWWMYYLNSFVSAQGVWYSTLSSSGLVRWMIRTSVNLPNPLALGCLFWAALGDARFVDASDDEPPVFRKDDGSEAPPPTTTS